MGNTFRHRNGAPAIRSSFTTPSLTRRGTVPLSGYQRRNKSVSRKLRHVEEPTHRPVTDSRRSLRGSRGRAAVLSDLPLLLDLTSPTRLSSGDA